MGGFSASLFKFKVINKDDPTDVAGGWQEADATVKFADGRQAPVAGWFCTLSIGMPLRTVSRARSAPRGRRRSRAGVATDASGKIMHSKGSWVPAEFCNAWQDKMKELFKEKPYKGIGPRIKA